MVVVNLRISRVCLKAVGAERRRANDIRAINILDFIIYHFLGPTTFLAILLSLTFSLQTPPCKSCSP
jgi:hypothetical protein